MRKYIIVDIKAINLCQLHLFNTESINRWFGVNIFFTVRINFNRRRLHCSLHTCSDVGCITDWLKFWSQSNLLWMPITNIHYTSTLYNQQNENLIKMIKLNDHYPPFCIFQQHWMLNWVNHLLENIVWETKKNGTLGFFQRFLLEMVQYLKH